jgi:ABC-type phosphate transport system substrate-binding protein
VFGIAVNDASLAAVTNLTRADITSIFSGAYGDWGQVPNAAGTGFYAPGPITVCKRTPGSGTQATASAYFNGVGCSAAALPFVQPPGGPIFGNPVINNGAAGDLQACIVANPGSIGILNYSTAAVAGRRFISVDGVAPSKANAALGRYAFWSESTFNNSTRLTGTAATLATVLQTRATNAATIPVVDDVFALYNGGANSPVMPLNATRPTGLFTKNGNNCQLPVGTL